MFAPAFHLNKQSLAWAQVSGLVTITFCCTQKAEPLISTAMHKTFDSFEECRNNITKSTTADTACLRNESYSGMILVILLCI